MLLQLVESAYNVTYQTQACSPCSHDPGAKPSYQLMLAQNAKAGCCVSMSSITCKAKSNWCSMIMRWPKAACTSSNIAVSAGSCLRMSSEPRKIFSKYNQFFCTCRSAVTSELCCKQVHKVLSVNSHCRASMWRLKALTRHASGQSLTFSQARQVADN